MKQRRELASQTRQSSTAWAYLVVSSEQQSETIEYQRRWANETARQHGWTITETFDGVSSGRDGTRAILKRLLARLEKIPSANRPERVLMIRLDRLGRGLGLEAVQALAEITLLGVIVHTRQDGDNKIARASDSLLPLLRIVTGGIENEARRDKALDTYKRRRESGHVVSNKRPYGIRVECGLDVADEPSAGAVRLAFELSSNGFGYAAIGTRLRAIAAAKVYRNGRSHNTEWTNDRVRKLLRHRAYRGVVVDKQQWDRVYRLLENVPDTRIRKHPWPLSGALHCSCGRILIGSLRGSPARRVYRCNAVGVHKRYLTYAASRIESQFSDLLVSLQASTKTLDAYASQSVSLTDLDMLVIETKRNDALVVIEHAEREKIRIWELNTKGLLPDVHLAQRLAALESNVIESRTTLDQIEIEVQRIMHIQHDVNEASTLLDSAAALWNEASVNDKAAAARALARAFHGFCVTETGILIVGPPTARSRFFSQGAGQK